MERSEITRIAGLSSVRRLPRGGKVRLGVKVKNSQGKEYPREVSYFVCPPEVKAIYGEQPKELDIMFPVEDETKFFPQARKWYGSTQGLKCKGNGEVALRRFEDCSDEQKAMVKNNNGNKDIEIKCPCEKADKECSVSGNLMVLLHKVSLGVVYQIDTGSVSNIITINSYIDYLRSITNGRIALIPLKLRRVEQEMLYTDKEGKTCKSKHSMLQLELKITMDDIDRLRRDRIALIGTNYQIAPPVEEGKDIPEVVIDEETPPQEEAENPTIKKVDELPIIQESPANKQLTALRKAIHINIASCGITDDQYRNYLKLKWGSTSSTEILHSATLQEMLIYFNPATFNKEAFLENYGEE